MSVDEISPYRRDLLRFAMLQLRNNELAEDVVQETLLAGFEGLSKFENRSHIKTWLFSILKFKIIDVIRAKKREIVHGVDYIDEATIQEIPNEAIDGFFKPDGHWDQPDAPSTWGNPQATLENHQFWVIFDACMNKLPAQTSRVFLMREFLGLETAEICNELKLTPTNCGVVLHRARMLLRACLDKNWFHNPAEQHG